MNWHAGIFYDEDADSTARPIVHIGGSGCRVYLVPYTASSGDYFLGDSDNNCMGVYIKSGIDSYAKDNIKNMAGDLTNENIAYCFYNMLEHDSTGIWIYTWNIEKMRCYGVVEYCYEFYGYELQTDGDHWDISSTEDCGFTIYVKRVLAAKQRTIDYNLKNI